MIVAGYKPHRGNQNRLAQLPDVVARVEEIRKHSEQIVDLRKIDRGRLLIELARIACADAPLRAAIAQAGPEALGGAIPPVLLVDIRLDGVLAKHIEMRLLDEQHASVKGCVLGTTTPLTETLTGTVTFANNGSKGDQLLTDFENGAVGTIEASRFCQGRKNALTFEINGSKGSIVFELERLNELAVHLVDSRPGQRAQGFRQVLVSEAYHPFWEWWWPHGHIIGWEHKFIHELHHFLHAIATDGEVGPYGADFEDGYRVAEVCDAIVRSASSGTREEITYL